ncbi:YceK/YidQ family lipoprotein [Pseudomonas sp. TH08]|uniref:YceK/YidQ family lipoprotein n=1 Tax=unclassified Pseudomonas TaxID=196821 RepID=UPI00191472C2|nr:MULTISPECIES: YceK/YidQ family lipoprotein [unclassified Pseudomonas]MBK5530642.1 YceK/YidQ family lipoprotein [Pseudomonas sp. TH06]MBK5535486.1 YceK/YidQ family lipoprotein [Pseudomonas sp. TH08]
MALKTSALLLSALMISGCGTISSVFQEDTVAGNDLKTRQTYCDSISRIYSGIGYDFCVLHASELPMKAFGTGRPAAPLVLLDLAVSGVTDTLVLPYTAYQQVKHGNIEIYQAQTSNQ